MYNPIAAPGTCMRCMASFAYSINAWNLGEFVLSEFLVFIYTSLLSSSVLAFKMRPSKVAAVITEGRFQQQAPALRIRSKHIPCPSKDKFTAILRELS